MEFWWSFVVWRGFSGGNLAAVMLERSFGVLYWCLDSC